MVRWETPNQLRRRRRRRWKFLGFVLLAPLIGLYVWWRVEIGRSLAAAAAEERSRPREGKARESRFELFKEGSPTTNRAFTLEKIVPATNAGPR